MRKFLWILAFLAFLAFLCPASAFAQNCSGVFPAGSVCGSSSGGLPGPVGTSNAPLSGLYLNGGTFAGAPNFTGVPLFSGISPGTCNEGIAIDSGGHLIETTCPGSATSVQAGSGGTTITGTCTTLFIAYNNGGTLYCESIASAMSGVTLTGGINLNGQTLSGNVTFSGTVTLGGVTGSTAQCVQASTAGALGGTGAPCGMVLLNTIQTPTGVTATFTNSSAVIGATNTFVVGQAVVFTTTGGLPTNFTAGTVYYVISTGLSSSQFEVASTIGGSAITAGSAGTGTQTVTTYWVDTTSLTSTYSSYRIVYENLIPATTANTLSLNLGTSATFIGSTSNLYGATTVTPSGASFYGSTGAALTIISASASVTNAQPGTSGEIVIFNPSGTSAYKHTIFDSIIDDSTTPLAVNGGGWVATTSAVTMLQLYFSVGGVPSSGVVRIYGIP